MAIAAVPRRGPWLSFGAMMLLAAALPKPVAGSKKSKRIKKKKCKKQVAQCTASLEEACQGNAECLANLTCCGLLADCNAAAALPCIFINAT
jgi:hypothetical protein